MVMHSHARAQLRTLVGPVVLPMVALVAAAAWLGYRLAAVSALQGADALDASAWWAAAWPPMLLFALLAVMACLAVRKAVLPWLDLAQAVQARAAHDGGAIEVAPASPHAVQAMATALNRLLARAHAESDAQQRFVADAAHQLRTPLAGLQSQVEAWALMAQATPEKSIVLPAAHVEQLRRAARRTTQLANQLLVLSRVESQLGQGEQKQRVDLQSVCESLLASYLDRALAKDLDLGLEMAPAHVTGHEWLLRELISNLLDNAIKYTPRGGHITLRCGKHDTTETSARVFIEVEDDGPGVAVSEYARLTQRFYRAPGAACEGTGLGLAIAQEIAQGHGADLQFSPGSGNRGLRVSLLFEE